MPRRLRAEQIIEKLNRAIVGVVGATDYRELMIKLGSVPVSSTPQEFQAVIDAALRDAAPIIDEFKLQMD